MRKFRMEQLQCHIWIRPPHILGNIFAFPHILGSPSSYDFATAPLWISLYMRKICFPFFWVQASTVHNYIQYTVNQPFYYWCDMILILQYRDLSYVARNTNQYFLKNSERSSPFLIFLIGLLWVTVLNMFSAEILQLLFSSPAQVTIVYA